MKDGIKLQEIKDFYNNYVDHLVMENERHRHIIKSLQNIISKNMTVLDVGCGTGITTEAISKLAYYVLGVDIAENLIGCAKKRVNADFIVGDFCDLALKKKFNIVCLVDVLEHIIPSRIWSFLDNVKKYAEDYVYLNIPDSRFNKFLRERCPDLLQVVDEPYDIAYVVWLFESRGFSPLHIFIYGDHRLPHYDEFLFIKNGKLKYDGKETNFYARGEENQILRES